MISVLILIAKGIGILLCFCFLSLFVWVSVVLMAEHIIRFYFKQKKKYHMEIIDDSGIREALKDREILREYPRA